MFIQLFNIKILQNIIRFFQKIKIKYPYLLLILKIIKGIHIVYKMVINKKSSPGGELFANQL